jgi:hypothetical protein
VEYETGWTMGLGTPERFRDSVDRIARWRAEAGMETTVRAIASSHYALGPGAGDVLRSFILDYFAHLGPYAEIVAGNCAADDVALARTIAGFEAVAADELIFIPTRTGIDQLELLAEVAFD